MKTINLEVILYRESESERWEIKELKDSYGKGRIMISCMRARYIFESWLEKNNPTEFLQSNGVTGDGTQNIYHYISLSVVDGNIFYRKVKEPDHDDLIVDVIGMHDEDDFSYISSISNSDCIDTIAENYYKFRERSVMEEIPLHLI